MTTETSKIPYLADAPIYSLTARRFHWWMAGLILFMIPLGFIMSDDDNPFKLSDAFIGQLNSLHKLTGMIILVLVVARLIYRFRHGAPPSVATLTPLEKGASHANHWILYLLILAMPIGGWIGVSMYGARDIFGLFSLPQIAPVDQKLSETVFKFHTLGAYAILLFASVHIGAALYHRFIRRDGVLRRMLPGANDA